MAKNSDALVLAKSALDYAYGWFDYRVWRSRIPGAQAAVMIGGDLVMNRGVGLADIASGERVGTAHQFRVASHSKWLTATAIARLADEGIISFDDTLATHVDELDGTHFGSVTLRDLLTHASGITRDSDDGSFWDAAIEFPARDRVLEIAAGAADVFAPRSAFKYSNIGYGLLGIALEEITGRSYEESMRELVTRPLGLSRTVVDIDDRKAAKPVTGYSGIVTDHRRTALPSMSAGALHAATGFTSTAAELARFGHAHVRGNEELLSDRARAAMQLPVRQYRDRGGEESAYGLGTMVKVIRGRRWIGHGGSWLGQSTRTLVEPKLGIVVSVLTNAIDGPAEELATGIASLIIGSQEREAPALSLTGIDDIPTGSGTAAPTRTARRVDPSRFVGRFASEWMIIDVVQLGERLLAISPQSADPMAQAAELTIIDETTLRLPVEDGIGPVGELLHYDFDARGRVKQITGAWRVSPAPSLEAFPLQ